MLHNPHTDYHGIDSVVVKEATVNSLIKEETEEGEMVIGVVAQEKSNNEELNVMYIYIHV